MKPTQFNLGQEVLRATEAWLAANQVGVPESIKILERHECKTCGAYGPDRMFQTYCSRPDCPAKHTSTKGETTMDAKQLAALKNFVQLLTDPENQPHQYVGDGKRLYRELLLLMVPDEQAS